MPTKKQQGELMSPTGGDLSSPSIGGITVSVPQPLPQPSSMLTILELAIKQNVNPETLARLLEVKQQWERDESKKAFTRAFNAFKKKAPNLEKVATVDFESKSGSRTNFNFSPLDYISGILNPALAEYDLSFRWRLDQLDAPKIGVTCVLEHIAGGFDEVRWAEEPLDDGRMNKHQRGEGSITILQRVTLLCVCGLAPRDTLGEMARNERLKKPKVMEDLNERLEWLKNAESLAELKSLFHDAYRKAKGIHDESACKMLEAAKDLRKQELQPPPKQEEPF